MFNKLSTVLLAFCGVSFLLFLFKGYEIYIELNERKDDLLQTISYKTAPSYSDLSDTFIDTISTLNMTEKEFVFITLSPESLMHDVNFNMLVTKLNYPIYSSGPLQKTSENVRNTNTLKRIAFIKDLILKADIVDDIILNKFKLAFPGKNIIFLIDNSKTITSKKLLVLAETPEGKIVKFDTRQHFPVKE